MPPRSLRPLLKWVRTGSSAGKLEVDTSRILIVDDESGIRQSLSGALQDEGYACAVAGTGEACLAELENSSYDAVLLDIWLPGLDGPRDTRPDLTVAGMAARASGRDHDFRPRQH